MTETADAITFRLGSGRRHRVSRGRIVTPNSTVHAACHTCPGPPAVETPASHGVQARLSEPTLREQRAAGPTSVPPASSRPRRMEAPLLFHQAGHTFWIEDCSTTRSSQRHPAADTQVLRHRLLGSQRPNRREAVGDTSTLGPSRRGQHYGALGGPGLASLGGGTRGHRMLRQQRERPP